MDLNKGEKNWFRNISWGINLSLCIKHTTKTIFIEYLWTDWEEEEHLFSSGKINEEMNSGS